jgi:hypothetical protein
VVRATTLLIWAWVLGGWLRRIRRGRKVAPGAEPAA